MQALQFFAGPRALAQLREHGLRAQDVAVVPAAAGGPKGLIFQALDQYLFGHWLPAAPRTRSLVGASIGAWRMAAACQRDPVAAFARLGELYCNQRYTAKPGPAEIDQVCRQLLSDFVSGHEADILSHPQHRLHMLAVRGRGLLGNPQSRAAQMRGFAAAVALNLAGRPQLGRLMERVFLSDVREQPHWLHSPFDQFATHIAPLTEQSLAEALLASGTLPMVMEPVRGIPGAPPGTYWDGGMIDYNLALPYARLGPGELVLYPHFTRHIVPGWLDKSLPWRRAARGPQRHWLDNVLIAAPSAEFLQGLPRGKLPDRADFAYYGVQHDERIRQWQRAIAEGARLRDAFAGFVQDPRPELIQPM